MKSKIIEKILNEDNKTLNEIIEIIKDNAVFQDVMSDFKEEFFIDDNIHGISHNERVALLACYIGIQEGLNDEELRLVLEAAKYHDIGRGFEGNHGQYSAIVIDRNKEHIFPNLSDDEINTIKALCNAHSVDDNRYIEIAKLYGIENIEKFKKLLDIVKDADALDRVRLPRFGQLEEKYLRTETSKRIIDFSKELFREYRDIQQELTKENLREHDVMSNYQVNTGLRSQLLFDGESYYLVRSLNKADIESLDKRNGIIQKVDNKGDYTVQDVMAQIRMQHRKTNLISMSEDPNIVLTYDKSNLHRFVLIKLSKDEIEDSKKVFSAGEYLLGVMDYQIEKQAQNAPLKVRQILERVDKASSIEEIIKIINGADRQVATSLVESKQQYLNEVEQIEQSKKIAKCKVLNYYGLMRGITHDEKGKLIDISGFTQIMRNGYSSSEWLHSGKIEQEKLIDIPKILVDALALIKQAEFQGKDKEILKQVETEILSLVLSGEKIDQDNYQMEYSAHNNLRSDLTIDKAFEITRGQISYRDTNMQMTAIRSVAEMTLNKRKIIALLQERLPNINLDEMLAYTYCINQEMITRKNNRGSQIGRNINFIISDYGYDFDDEVSARILQSVENLGDEQLSNIISKGVDAQEISSLLIRTRENAERIQAYKSKSVSSKYIAEAIVEGYNWKNEGNTLTSNEKVIMTNRLLRSVGTNNELYNLYEAINKIQIGRNKFTQNDIFAIIINLAVDEKIGDISYRELTKKDRKDIQNILLDNKEQLQTSVLPISIDLLARQGREINKLKKELIDLGIERNFIELKDIKNVYIAKQIVDGYDFGRELKQEEKKVLLKFILNSNSLNVNSCYLTTLIHNMGKIGLSPQEIYGMIINLAVNGNVLEEKGYGYSNLLGNVNNACKTIIKYKNKIQTSVTEGTILKAKSIDQSEDNQEKIKQELIDLGIERNFIELKDIKNVYIAKQIVDGYDFGRELKQEEKKVLLKFILNSNSLNVNSCYLTTLIHNMGKIGLSPQEIYGMIINLAVNGNVLEEKGYGYSNLLGNVNNACKTIIKYKNKIQTSVTEGTILKAKSIDQSEDNQEKIKQELIDLGIDKDFIELKDIRNIYTAKEILDNYSFERELSREEKRELIQTLLNISDLNKNMNRYLTTLIRNMEQIGFNIQEIYGIIINLSINRKILEETGYSYNDLLSNKNNSCQSIKDYKCFLQTKITKGTKLKLKSINQNKDYQEGIKRELINIGIDSDFVESKDIKNVYVAKQIVEGYNWRKELTVEEKKAIVKSILDNAGLNKNGTSYISTMIYNLEQAGFDEQEIYGMIINLGVNGKILEKTGFEYNILLQSKNRLTKINEYRHEIQTNVTRGTILKAKSLNLSEKEQEKIKQKLINLGIDKDFIESKDIGNVYIANQIVENYNFYENIRSEEKKAIVKAILDNAGLNKNGRRYISTMIYNLEQAGFGEQEIYGMIINLGINGSVSVEKGFSYKDFLSNTGNVWQIQKYKERIRTSVSKGMVIKAMSEQLSLEEQDKIKNELVSSGIDKDFLDSKDIRNIYTAKQIVENYSFARKLKNEEKSALLTLILDNGKLNNKRANYLTKLIQNMEQIGLNIQQIYGMIINLGVDGNILEETGYGYTALLANKYNSCQTIIRHKERIHTQVTEETIQRALEIANNPKKVKGQDIAKATLELTIASSGGSQVCDDVQADYQRLMDEKIKKNEIEWGE